MRRTIQNSAAVVHAGHLFRRKTRRERESVQQATEADLLTRTHDSGCAEPSKTRPLSSMPVTCSDGRRAERDSVQQATEADWLTMERDSGCAEPVRISAASAYAGYFRHNNQSLPIEYSFPKYVPVPMYVHTVTSLV
jgi:hypothetical protein